LVDLIDKNITGKDADAAASRVKTGSSSTISTHRRGHRANAAWSGSFQLEIAYPVSLLSARRAND
jgi:hypothetical protein